MSVPQQFAEESILAAARPIDRLDDFGNDALRAPLRVLLGHDVRAAFRQKLAELAASIDEWGHVTVDVGSTPDH